MHAVHAEGIVHQDLKLENIMLDAFANIKVWHRERVSMRSVVGNKMVVTSGRDPLRCRSPSSPDHSRDHRWKYFSLLLTPPLYDQLIDFGLCHHARLAERPKTFCGSPEYAAPELVAGTDFTGPAVDVYVVAFGGSSSARGLTFR